MINTGINRENVVFSQETVDRVLFKVAQRRKIIILGANWKSVIFRGRYNIDIEYYAVVNKQNNQQKQTYDGVELRSIYDIAYETPGTFYVVCSDIELTFPVVYKFLLGMGLKTLDDYCTVECLNEFKDVMDDVHLHYTMRYEFPGVKIFGNENNKTALRIVTLGGSTTDPLVNYPSGASWPQHLFDILQRSDIQAIIYNCGTCAYSSAREFIKLCRDGLLLEPDLVISYGGVNDLNPSDEFFTNRHKRPWVDHWTETQARTAGNHLGGMMTYGLQSDKTEAENWVKHVRMMRGVCGELDVKFAAFFQPFIGTGEKISEFEEILFKSDCLWRFNTHPYYRAHCNAYKQERIAEFADSVTELIKNIPYIFNKRDIFINNAELLIDLCHVADDGNHFIAQHIFQSLLKNGYLEQER